jgi:predicted transcriptional regulator
MRFKAVAMSSQLKDSQMSIRLPDALKEEMATYAALTGRSTHHVAMEALREYLDWRTPQIADLRKAIAAADDGDFASDEEVAAVFDRCAKPAPAPARKQRKTPARRRG